MTDPVRAMNVRVVVSATRTDTQVLRRPDGTMEAILCPWDQSPAATLDALHGLLTDRERVELEAALDDGKERT